jgi:hypothetical protein
MQKWSNMSGWPTQLISQGPKAEKKDDKTIFNNLKSL